MQPTPEQLAIIQGFGSAALSLVTAAEIEVVPFIATDNLIARSRTKWALPALESIATLLVGRSFMLDHDWEEVENITGLVFQAEVLHLNQIPQEYLRPKGNQELFIKEGYHPVLAWVAFPRTSSLLSGLQLGALQNVSIGYFVVDELICPHCEVSFWDADCPHVPPSNWWRDGISTAAYAIRPDTSDMGELSLVSIPDVPGAQMILNKYADLYAISQTSE